MKDCHFSVMKFLVVCFIFFTLSISGTRCKETRHIYDEDEYKNNDYDNDNSNVYLNIGDGSTHLQTKQNTSSDHGNDDDYNVYIGPFSKPLRKESDTNYEDEQDNDDDTGYIGPASTALGDIKNNDTSLLSLKTRMDYYWNSSLEFKYVDYMPDEIIPYFSAIEIYFTQDTDDFCTNKLRSYLSLYRNRINRIDLMDFFTDKVECVEKVAFTRDIIRVYSIDVDYTNLLIAFVDDTGSISNSSVLMFTSSKCRERFLSGITNTKTNRTNAFNNLGYIYHINTFTTTTTQLIQ